MACSDNRNKCPARSTQSPSVLVPSDVGEWGTFAFVDGVFNQFRFHPTVAVRTKYCCYHIAVFFLGEFVKLKRVFVVTLRFNFERLGGFASDSLS